MALSELEMVNIVIRSIGMAPALTLDESSQQVALSQLAIGHVRREILSVGWVFNTDTVDLSYSSEHGKILIPSAYLKVYLSDGYVVRNGGVWYNAGAEFYTDDLTNIKIVIDIPNDEMPEPFQQYVAYKACERMWEDTNGETAPLHIRERTARAWAKAAASEKNGLKMATGISSMESAHTSEI